MDRHQRIRSRAEDNKRAARHRTPNGPGSGLRPGMAEGRGPRPPARGGFTRRFSAADFKGNSRHNSGEGDNISWCRTGTFMSRPDDRAAASGAGRGAERPGGGGRGPAAGGDPAAGADGRTAPRRAAVGLTAGRRHLGAADTAGPRAAERAGGGAAGGPVLHRGPAGGDDGAAPRPPAAPKGPERAAPALRPAAMPPPGPTAAPPARYPARRWASASPEGPSTPADTRATRISCRFIVYSPECPS